MNPSTINVLLIEDNPGDVHLVKTLLAQSSVVGSGASVINLTHTERLTSAQTALCSEPCDLVLLDLSLPDTNGLNSFLELNQFHPTIPVVILSGHTDHELSIQAVQLGAQDYLSKNDLSTNLLSKPFFTPSSATGCCWKLASGSELENQNLALNDFAHTVAHKITTCHIQQYNRDFFCYVQFIQVRTNFN